MMIGRIFIYTLQHVSEKKDYSYMASNWFRIDLEDPYDCGDVVRTSVSSRAKKHPMIIRFTNTDHDYWLALLVTTSIIACASMIILIIIHHS